jgi:hypothetical protein
MMKCIQVRHYIFYINIEFYIYIYSSAKLSKNYEPHTVRYAPHTVRYKPHTVRYEPHTVRYEPHTVHLNTLFCYEEWYIFKLYVHFVGIISNYCFDFCISK